MSHDYLAADSDGVSHAISLCASGSFFGTDTVLYAADTTIVAKSGVDATYRVVLKWVGPGVPFGAATITVTIGTVGTALINAGFEGISGTIPTDGLVDYYPFNGNADDESGNGNDGTIYGANFVQGKNGSCIEFDPSQNIEILNTSNEIDFANKSFSWAMWLKRDTLTTQVRQQKIRTQGYESNNRGLCIAFRSEDEFTFAFWYNDLDLPGPYNDTINWHHWAGTYDASTNQQIIYYDGQQVGQNTTSADYQGSGTIYLGDACSGPRSSCVWPDAYFEGKLDDLYFYKRPLTAEEVNALFTM
ncbi:MAG: LamG domain-containing protein [Chitinispirillaceae bacterium]|nr:LamG domain-containing protein [Chitinispirillaceae bacterium]